MGTGRNYTRPKISLLIVLATLSLRCDGRAVEASAEVFNSGIHSEGSSVFSGSMLNPFTAGVLRCFCHPHSLSVHCRKRGRLGFATVDEK